MKKFLLIFIILFVFYDVQSQNVGISDVLFTPQAPLHVFRNTDANILQLSKSSAANTGLIFSVSGNNWTMRNWQDGELQIRTGNSFLSFYTNNTERIRVLANGRVGIGMNSPNHVLTIDGSGMSSNDVLRLIGSGASGSGAFLRFGDADGAYIREDIDDGLLIYSTDRKALMGGNVGIGDNTPLALLTVGNNDLFRVQNTGHVRTISGTASAPAYSFTGTTTTGIFSPGTNILSFSTNSAERMRINETGQVGIGASAPTARLHVVGSVRLQNLDPPSTEQTALFIDNEGYIKARVLNPIALNGFTEMDTLAWLRAGNVAKPTDFIGTLNSIDFRIFTSSSERMRVTTAGHVGIGTNNPANRLDVQFDGSDRVARIRNLSNTGGAHGLLVSTTRTSADAYILNLDAGGASRMYMRSDGNVGIGTTSPTAQLHTTGTVRFANYPSGANGAIVRTDNQGNISITNFTGNSNDVLYGTGSFGPLPAQLSAWEITGNSNTTSGTNFVGTTNAQALDFRTNNTLRFRIANENQVHAMADGTAALPFYSFHNNTGIGMYRSGTNQLSFSTDGTERLRLVSGGQIQAISDGNADTPVWSFGNSSKMGFFRAGANILGVSTNGLERMRIDANGNVGINTTNPTERLHVEGNVRFSGALMPNNNAGTSGQVLVSQGPGNAPQWQTPANLPMYGNNAHTVSLATLVTNTYTGGWSDIPGMIITFTPVHSTFYIFASFCARLADNNGNAQFGQALIQARILVNNVEVAKAASIITDFDDDFWGMYIITSGTVAFSGIRVNATIGQSTTVKIQWKPVILWADSPWRVEINPTNANTADHCVLTVFD